MKRVFAFALLAGIALPSSAALAQAGPADAPTAGISQNILGDQAPQQNIVQDGQPRGELGGLASGAPSVANVQPAAGAPTAAPAIAGGQAIAGQSTMVSGQSTVVATPTAVAQPALDIHQQHFLMARVMHHCLTRTLHDRFLAGQPPVARMGFGPGLPLFAPIGDLELQGVGMIADAAGDKGPMYRVTFRNDSRFVARNVQISLVAVMGKLSFESPVITVEVPEVAAGAIGTMDIQFPVAAPFDTLVAALDSFSELPESNEINNVITLTRANVAVIETTVTTAEATATAVAPAVAAPATGAAIAPAPVAPTAPLEGAAPAPEAAPAPTAPAPMDNSLDNIPLDSAEGTSALFTR